MAHIINQWKFKFQLKIELSLLNNLIYILIINQDYSELGIKEL